MNETKLAEDRARGERADQILKDPIFLEAFNSIDQRIFHAWEESDGDSKELRERLYLMKRVLKDIRHHFTVVIANGKHAAEELQIGD